jgi:PAS domain S-box-containing protein
MERPQDALVEENRRMRRVMRDLVALSTLPAVWIGFGLDSIARSLATALIKTLSLDLVYIRLGAQSENEAVEAVRSVNELEPHLEAAVKMRLRPLLERNIGSAPLTIIDPLGTERLRTVIIGFGIGDAQGALIACSRQEGFPSVQDRLLLGVGANQTAVVLQRRQSEDREQQQREWLRVTLSSIGDAVVATDIDGQVIFLNSAAENLTGWPQAEALGKPVESVFAAAAEESRQPVENPLGRVLRDSSAHEVSSAGQHTILFTRGGGEQAIDYSAAPIRNSTGETIGVVIVFRSVVDQRRVERLRNTRLAVTQALNSARGADEVVAAVLRGVCEHLSWDVGFFWTAEGDGEVLEFRGSWHQEGMLVPDFAEDSRTRKLARGEGLPGRVLESGRSVWVPEVAAEPGFLRFESATLSGLKSAFACPIAIDGCNIGVIEFYSVRLRSSDREVIETVAAIAGNVGQFMERKAAEEELRRSEEELSEFFENATVGLHWVGPDGTILRANRAELEMLGYSREEYVGRPIADFHADFEVGCDILDKLKAGESLAEYPARLLCKDGSIRQVLIDSSVMWRDDQFVHTRCFTRDVTARREAEIALDQARSQLDAALEAGAIATWTWDIRENRLFADRQLARLFNLPPSDAEGGLLTRYIQAIHPDDVGSVKAALARSVQAREEYSADYRIVQADGSVRWVSARGRPEFDSDGQPLRMPGVLVDITERKLLEGELRVRLEQLADADRRKDEFLATLAHELRNPLAPIRNSLEIMKMPRLDATTVQLTREVMERQVHHLVRLVDDLLDVSRVTRGKIELRSEPVELATVVARAVEMAQSLIESKAHHLALSLPEQSLLVKADPVRLTQVIGNLLTNSAKYTEPNGHIWVTARAEAGDAIISVRDDGIGISPELLPHVFELFVQADHASTKAAGGLGIGLTLVRNLVHMHGGSVKAHSAGLGEGCEFLVRLPLLADHEQGLSDAEDRRPPASPSRAVRVLIVDDNRDAADSLAALLALYGHEVRIAHDGAAAIATALSYLPNLIFLDIGMPGMDGYEVARRIRAEPTLRGTVVTALTGWGQQEDRRRTAEAGFDHHMVKPPDPKAVVSLLESLTLASLTRA